MNRMINKIQSSIIKESNDDSYHNSIELEVSDGKYRDGVEYGAQKVQINYEFSLQYDSFGIWSINFSLVSSVHVTIESIDADGNDRPEINVDIDKFNIYDNIEWVPALSYAPIKLEVTLDENEKLKSYKFYVSYINKEQ